MVVPSQRGVSLQDKLLDDQTQFWSPEEDGLYVGLPPHCSRRQWNVVESRLHLHSNKSADSFICGSFFFVIENK